MRTLFKAALLGAIAVAVAPPVLAQPPAAALGHPLPDASLAAGTVSVRVVAGSPAAAVTGSEVTLIVNGAPRIARTDASGRAMFNDLPAGATVQAKIQDAEGKDLTSDAFPVPSSGGARVMLSTKPFTSGGGGAPFAGGGGGAGGMPEPRKISGQPRPDRDTPGSTYVVRLTYNDLAAKPGPEGPPAGVDVTLVGYAADDSVTVTTVKSDENGRATFEGLDPSGATGYFALANIPRGSGVDRLYALPVQMDPQSGVRVMLSAEKRDSKAPNIDQYVMAQATLATPPGKIRVTLDGLPGGDAPVKLIDAATGAVIAQAKTASMEGDPTTMQGGSSFTAKPDLPAGAIDVYVHGGVGSDAPLGDVAIRVIPADAQQVEGDAVKTGTDGKVRAQAPATALGDGKQQRVVFTILGREFVSDAFDASKTGGSLEITAKWSAGGRPQALFDVAPKPGLVVYAEATVGGKLAGTYRSQPVLPVADAGTHLPIIVYPRIILKFSMRASVEDQLLAAQGRFTVENNSWIPYRTSTEGMVIGAPKGFKGGVVADMNQADVAVVPGEGFRIMRPLPPGSGKTFVAGFSLPIEDGRVEWALDLPLGTVGSDIKIRHTDGMVVEAPGGAGKQPVEMNDGNYYHEINNITIGRNKSMIMTIAGLPSPPAWKLWAPRLIGLLVIALILGGVVFAIVSASKAQPAVATLSRKNALLDELVELERSGANNARREELTRELEKLW